LELILAQRTPPLYASRRLNEYNDYYTAIDDINSILSRDLIGPVEQTEAIDDVAPLNYYKLGILWPKRIDSGYGPSQDDVAETLDDFEDPLEGDDGISNANAYKPSSMGISIMLPSETKILDISVTFGKYTYSDKQAIINEKQKTVIEYTRTPYKFNTSFAIQNDCGSVKCKNFDELHELGVAVILTVRKVLGDGSKLATVSINNSNSASIQKRDQNECALFQCELALTNPSGFMPVYRYSPVGQNDDELIGSMLNRDVQNYAYGHGCSVKYENDGEDGNAVTTIRSDFMPCESVLQMMPGNIQKKDILRLNFWAGAERSAACTCLTRFVDEYAKWHGRQSVIARTLDRYKNPAQTVIKRIGICIDRLRNGITELKKNDFAWESFLLMNEAMYLQRIKYKKIPETQSDSVRWHPFQLAYILQIIQDIANPCSGYQYRVVDKQRDDPQPHRG